MFNHDHHNQIHLILRSLNSVLFESTSSYFGGGTLVTLLNNEYRWSQDVDFICPIGPGYRKLRGILADAGHRPETLFSRTEGLAFPREARADQYGVRFLIEANGTPIKFEIIAEARIKLDPPQRYPDIPVPCLSFDDACSEKLLANADRWMDTSIESRDLIDLAVLRSGGKIPDGAIAKAESAYPVTEPLKLAVRHFNCRPLYRERCFKALEITNPSLIMEGLNKLTEQFDVPPCDEDSEESPLMS